MNARLNFKGKIVEIKDIIKAEGIKKFTGLMFSKGKHALLFDFSNPSKRAIHSLFCPNFLAIWLNDGKIVDYKLVNRREMLIKPRTEFNKLLEIPANEKYMDIVGIFSHERKDLNTSSS